MNRRLEVLVQDTRALSRRRLHLDDFDRLDVLVSRCGLCGAHTIANRPCATPHDLVDHSDVGSVRLDRAVVVAVGGAFYAAVVLVLAAWFGVI